MAFNDANCFEAAWTFYAQVVTPNQLEDDEEYQEILEDMRMECGKYGMYLRSDRIETRSSFYQVHVIF